MKPWQKKGWCIAPEHNAAFVCAMEDVLEVYSRPYNAARPQVCLDEAAKQILSEVREPIAMEAGQAQRVDNEYVRQGTCALFMVFEPLAQSRWRDRASVRCRFGTGARARTLLRWCATFVTRCTLRRKRSCWCKTT